MSVAPQRYLAGTGVDLSYPAANRFAQANGSITGVVDNGSGACRVTSANHDLATGARVVITAVAGATGVNGTHVITRISSDTFDLDGSTFGGTYTSGGIWTAVLRHAPSANTAAIVTLDADTARANILGQLHGSYSAAPTGGSLQVEDGSGHVVWSVAITAAGPFEYIFNPPLHGTLNRAMIVTLAAGGGSVSGIVNVNAWREY